MNIKQLKVLLKPKIKNAKYPARLIHPWELLGFHYVNYFEVQIPDGGYCLEERDNQWEVYYLERGKKNEVEYFKSETEACQYFYNWIINSDF